MCLLQISELVRYNHARPVRQLIAPRVHPQPVLIGKRSYHPVLIHDVRPNVRALDIQRIRFQTEVFPQLKHRPPYVIRPHLRQQSALPRVNHIERIPLDKHGHACRNQPHRINPLPLLSLFDRVRQHLSHPHLLHLQPQVSLLCPCLLQRLLHLQERSGINGNRSRIHCGTCCHARH
ncbi:hypothetical protein Barb6_00495 [Bacteroidales bacterium Barb6]|nr:hypothetical protein Barb6_00495 [Bacteroidales bacterium Barb6]